MYVTGGDMSRPDHPLLCRLLIRDCFSVEAGALEALSGATADNLVPRAQWTKDCYFARLEVESPHHPRGARTQRER